jgi:nicotinamide mononucleotide adenylyltransferase
MIRSYLCILTLLSIFNIVSARDYLVRIDELFNSRQFFIIEQIGSSVIAIATDEEIALMEQQKYRYAVLDENPREKIYYLMYPVRETRESIAQVASVLAEIQNVFLVSIASARERDLLGLDLESKLLENERMTFIALPPAELLTARITGNPDIQKLVNSVSTDTLAGFIRYLQTIPSRHVNFPFTTEKAIPWICKKLKDYGCDSVYTQPVPGYNAPNAIGIKLGVKYPSYTKYYIIDDKHQMVCKQRTFCTITVVGC